MIVELNSALLSLSLSLEQLAKQVDAQGTGMTHLVGGAPIKRSEMFDAIMGVSEDTFKEILGVTTEPDLEKARKVVGGNLNNFNGLVKGSKYVFPGCWENFGAPRVGKLFKKMQGTGGGRLFVLLKSQHKKEADVRWLQEHFPGAVFQIASTFACLEGGAIKFNSHLNDMSKFPVQGEDAVLATITGAVIRKYLVPLRPSRKRPSREKTFRDLLRNVRDFFVFHGTDPSSHDYFRVKDINKKLDLDALENNVRVGIHRRVSVTSGAIEPEILMSRMSKGKRVFFPEYDRRIEPAPTVHQIFTAALDLNKRRNSEASVKKLKNSGAAQAILRGMYKGTVAAAWDILIREEGLSGSVKNLSEFLNPKNKIPRLFLTMVGTGSFRNDPQWIVDIIGGLKDAIEKSGLQVCVVVWDDAQKKQPWVENLKKLASH